ncbi:hypothetical protein FNV43_RR12440 [Rhamnella rubrinervis]|uniref:HXXXD-type acyl-transferase family protein n=1 Tax=Rhamnella rubrinervis TaxID=2594499 RepID=A0A8K0MIW1_9ROSA|nr:hypothetical protein FNV43_RR12440 [Rhamnella rubrinervis]
MSPIHFISTSTIQLTNAHQNHPQRIELTPGDLRVLRFNQNQKGLIFHKPKHLSNDQGLIEQLKTTLSHTLHIFYPLAGRLGLIENGNDDQTCCFFLHCNGEGAQFVHAVADGVTVADILEPTIVPDDLVYSFFPMNGLFNYQGISNPLLAVQVTELVDGIFIGCTMNHCVGDGTSFWHFFNTWSEICRRGGCVDQLSQPHPDLAREQLLNGIADLPIRIQRFQYHGIPERSVGPPLQQRVFHFSKERISQLKAKANAEMETDKISSLQALMAHLWISVTRSRGLDANEEVAYFILAGTRQRMQPKLREEFLGNAITSGLVKSTAGELVKNGLGWAAWEINKMIASKTTEEVRKSLDNWVKCPTVLKFEGMIDRTKLVTGSSHRFDVYGNDFGWGKPLAVRSGPADKCDGRLTVFAGADPGSIDFEACLSPETLQAMAQDPEFWTHDVKPNFNIGVDLNGAAQATPL